MEKPLVSIIIPVYNVEKYLDRCVESIVNQTYKNLEIILVDDGSPDNCPAMCDAWAEKDIRIKVIHKENGGLSSARNAGLDVMTGQYVYFIDSDDEIKNNAIELLCDVALKNNCDMVLGRYLRIFNSTDDDNIYQPPFTDKVLFFDEDGFWNYHYLYCNTGDYEISVNMIISCNKLIKSSIFESLRFDVGKINEDEFIIHKIVSKCRKIGYVDSYLYSYFQTPCSISYIKNQKKLLDPIEAYYQRIKYFSEYKKTYTANAFGEAFGCISFNIANYQKSDPDFSKRIKKIYKEIYKMSKPFFGAIGIRRRIYFTSLLYSTTLFRLLRKLSKTVFRGNKNE